MALGTSLVLAVVSGAVFVWRDQQAMDSQDEDLREHAALTARLVVRSFEATEPDKRPAHTDQLARNLVELPDIHNILVVALDGTVAYSHHADEVGRPFDPTNSEPCRGCHTPAGIRADSPEYRGRDGQPLYHKGFAIANEATCQRCHDPVHRNLGMLLMSLELTHRHRDATQRRASMAWSAIAGALASLLALGLLFRHLVRGPLSRLERDIRRLEKGDVAVLEGPVGRDEIADVHTAFTTMAERLRQARAALEARLREGAARIDSLSGELDLLYSNLMHVEHLSAMGTVSAQMAHEIRTPLNAMALNLQLLERGLAGREDIDETTSELLADVGREVQRIVEVLNQFMAQARRPAPEPGQERIGPVVESVAFLMAAEARRAGVSIEMSLTPEGRSPLVRPSPLRQILTNLVSNAVKATPAGGTVRIAVRLTPRGCPELSVEDSGPGVPEAQREQIFEPFYTTRPDGTGLGLGIVRHLVEEFRGRVEVGTSPLGGARFSVLLGDGTASGVGGTAPGEAT